MSRKLTLEDNNKHFTMTANFPCAQKKKKKKTQWKLVPKAFE